MEGIRQIVRANNFAPFCKSNFDLFICSNCLEETALCSGTYFCANKEDLRWCENAKSVKLLERLYDDDIYCNALGKSNEKSPVGQKIKKFNKGDGRTYNCFNRQDEDPFRVYVL